jgi:hypothetical protein
MGADDRQFRKVAVQTLDVRQSPVFDIENYGLWIILFHLVPQFLAGASYIYGKMRAKSTGQ